MKLLTVITLACVILATVKGEEHEGGGGEEGHHEQQTPPSGDDQQGHHEEAGQNQANGQQTGAGEGSNGKGEQGYQQGFNQGIKPYSYGYNTGIKPYTYNYYQPLGGKAQVSESGGDKMQDGKSMKNGQMKSKNGAAAAAQPPPPQMPPIPINIDFPDFSAFGLPPPPVPPQQQQQSGAYRAQPQQQQFVGPVGPSGSTPPPFNYAEYGIPTDVGTATGQSNNNSPFGLDNFGASGVQNQQRPQQQAAFPFGGGGGNNGDDFGIFGNGGNNNLNNNNNNNGNLPLIPVLEDGVNNNANNVNNANSGFGIPGIVGPNDFSVAASDFEPLNILDTLVPLNGYPNGVNGPGNPQSMRHTGASGVRGNPGGKILPPIQRPPTARSADTRANKTASSSNTVVTTSVTNDTSNNSKNSSNNLPSSAALMAQRRHYKLAVSPSNDLNDVLRSKRSISERPKEQFSKLDPNSAYSILNMDPQYTNPNQGVYSYYPAYNNPL